MKKKQNALMGHRTVERYEGKNTALIFIKMTTRSAEKKFVGKKIQAVFMGHNRKR